VGVSTPRPLVLAALAALALALGATTATASAAPKPGTFSGTLGVTVPKGADASVRAVDRATGALAGTASVSRQGAFMLKLPAGAYTVIGTVVPKRGKATRIVSAVSLKAGQKRAKADLKRSKKTKAKKKSKSKANPKAKRAYVQEHGQVTPGNVAAGIHAFTGNATGEWIYIQKGLQSLLTTDVLIAVEDCPVTIVEVERRADIIKELEFQQSKYVDPSTRVTRNFILEDVQVSGSVLQVDADHVTVTATITDNKTGKHIAQVTENVDSGHVFDQLQTFAENIGKELCTLHDTYDVALNLNANGTFATHNATGAFAGTLLAKRTSAPGTVPVVSTGSAPFAWTGLTCAMKIPITLCYGLIAPPVAWHATVTTSKDQLQVAWGIDGKDMATATFDVQPEDPADYDPPPIPGEPLVFSAGAAPQSFTLPYTGGPQAISGGITEGGDGFTTSGTITVTPAGYTAEP
jgi:hypothetical protein